jgi:hypothetical protein
MGQGTVLEVNPCVPVFGDPILVLRPYESKKITFFINHIACTKQIINIRLVYESQKYKFSTIVTEIHINLFFVDIISLAAIRGLSCQ